MAIPYLCHQVKTAVAVLVAISPRQTEGMVQVDTGRHRTEATSRRHPAATDLADTRRHRTEAKITVLVDISPHRMEATRLLQTGVTVQAVCLHR